MKPFPMWKHPLVAAARLTINSDRCTKWIDSGANLYGQRLSTRGAVKLGGKELKHQLAN